MYAVQEHTALSRERSTENGVVERERQGDGRDDDAQTVRTSSGQCGNAWTECPTVDAEPNLLLLSIRRQWLSPSSFNAIAQSMTPTSGIPNALALMGGCDATVALALWVPCR